LTSGISTIMCVALFLGSWGRARSTSPHQRVEPT